MREIKDSIGGLKVLAVCVDSTQRPFRPALSERKRSLLWQTAHTVARRPYPTPAHKDGRRPNKDLTDVQAEDLYIIRALPAMYLLDGEGKVKLKTYNPKQLLNECATDC